MILLRWGSLESMDHIRKLGLGHVGFEMIVRSLGGLVTWAVE